jgi:hypothetical protein
MRRFMRQLIIKPPNWRKLKYKNTLKPFLNTAKMRNTFWFNRKYSVSVDLCLYIYNKYLVFLHITNASSIPFFKVMNFYGALKIFYKP